MKILKSAGKFEVLTKPQDVISSIAMAARTCYKSEEFSTPETDKKLVKMLVEKNHSAMLEFSDMTVKFSGCSRGLTHELVRHRLCSFAQESTRYVDESNFEVVVPPHKDETEEILDDVEVVDCEGFNLVEWFESNENAYRTLRASGWKPEDARQVLPTAIKADIVVKANMREWRHIFDMRCSQFAHWEIREVMLKLLAWCKENIPVIFDDFHFFKTEAEIAYAAKVMSKKVLLAEINKYKEVYGNLFLEE